MLAILVYLSLVAACVVVGMTYGRWSVGSCCGCGCGTLANDDFNRASIGSDWATNAGSWSISGNKLRTSSSNALILYGTAAPGEDVIVTAKMTGSADDDKLRIILAYADSNNYLFAELQFEAFGGRLRLYSRTSGVDTLEGLAVLSFPVATGTETTVSACYSGTVFRANVSGVYVMDTQVTGFSGTQYGLGTGTITGTADFDDFTSTRTYETSTLCPRCGCVCASCGGNIQEQPCELEVVISGMANGACSSCAAIDGTYVLRRSNNLATCGWSVSLGGTCAYTTLNATFDGLTLTANISNIDQTDTVFWQSNPSTTNCSLWSSESLAYFTNGTQCNGSLSTASVSMESL